MRARTLGHVSAGPLAAQATILAQNLPWLVHTPSQLCLLFLFPLGKLKAQHEGMVAAQASPSITPHPHHSGDSRAGRQSSLLTCLHPSISELPVGFWDLFQGHHPFYIWVLSPAPFLSNP